MHLYMLRHGEAGSYTGMGDDSRRELTPEGMEKLRRQAKTLLKWKLKIDVIVSSPYTRAEQTAAIIAEAYHLTVQTDERLSATAFGAGTLGKLLTDHEKVKHLMIVGHEPSFSTVLGLVLGGAQVDYTKGSLASVHLVRLNPPEGMLRFFATPELQGA